MRQLLQKLAAHGMLWDQEKCTPPKTLSPFATLQGTKKMHTQNFLLRVSDPSRHRDELVCGFGRPEHCTSTSVLPRPIPVAWSHYMLSQYDELSAAGVA